MYHLLSIFVATFGHRDVSKPDTQSGNKKFAFKFSMKETEVLYLKMGFAEQQRGNENYAAVDVVTFSLIVAKRFENRRRKRDGTVDRDPSFESKQFKSRN